MNSDGVKSDGGKSDGGKSDALQGGDGGWEGVLPDKWVACFGEEYSSECVSASVGGTKPGRQGWV